MTTGRILLLLGLTAGSLMTACDGSSEAGIGTPAGEGETEPDVRPEAKSASFLPESVLELIRESDAVEAASLRVVAADEAEDHTLTGDARMVGYPLQDAATGLPTTEAEALTALLLDPSSYQQDPGRCRNQRMVGARFMRRAGTVEFALGIECRQALWGFRVDDEVRRWGGRLQPDVAERVIALLRGEAS